MRMPQVFKRAVDYAISCGAERICDLHGCWEAQVDEHWHISINGHAEMTPNSKGAPVPPFSVWVEFNGWPGGIVNAHGGTLCAGAIANEKELCDVLIRNTKAAA